MEQSEYAQQVLATIKQLEDEMARLEAQIKRAKDTIQTVAIRGLSETSGDAQQNLLWNLYWIHHKSVSTVSIAEALNIRINEIGKHVKDAYLSISCAACGKSYQVKVATRAKLKDAQGTEWRAKCPDCEAKEQEEAAARGQERQRQIAERESRLEELRAMPYKEYLKSPEWQATRERKLKRAQYRCELCFKAGRLNVHHKTYERRGNEDDHDLIVLCGTCHAKFHDKLIEE